MPGKNGSVDECVNVMLAPMRCVLCAVAAKQQILGISIFGLIVYV
jgi:hypothetical protein